MKGLFISDGVTPTGFSRVAHGIIGNLPDDWHIDHIAINYRGDPHKYKHNIYPASLGGDLWGFNRIKEFINNEYNFVFILNDIWVISEYLRVFKDLEETVDGYITPPIITYFPVDGTDFSEQWFHNFDLVKTAVVYTEFGRKVCSEVMPNIEFEIIPHGTDLEVFYPLGDKLEVRKQYFDKNPELWESFIVLNVNRNQPRKRIDVALEGFAEFVQDKPENVKYYHHAGIKDSGWDVLSLGTKLGIQHRIILTNTVKGNQKVTLPELNMIYNCADVGINTSTGEGWGLCSTEGAACGIPQIVPNHSACTELFEDVGILTPVNQYLWSPETLVKGGLVHPADVAESLEILYQNKELREILGRESYKKFTSKEYVWKDIAKKWQKIFERYDNNISQ